MSGIGLIFTVTVCAALKHPLATDLIVYTTLPVVLTVTKLNAVLIAPAATGVAWFEAPVTFVFATVQTYPTPDTVFGLVKTIVGVCPLQIVKMVLLTANVGFGSTVIVAVVVEPLHPFALGVIV